MKWFWIKILSSILFPFSKKKRKKFRDKYSQFKFVKDNAFRTYENKPVYSKDYMTLSDPFAQRNDIAIVMQGPLKKEWNFTVETIKMYRKNFAGCKVVVSTWDDEEKTVCNQLKDMGVTLVLSKPLESNYLNTHRQIISTRVGLENAKELGCKFALKTRTDQRLYETNVPEFLLNTLKAFPLKADIKTQNQRLITTSFNTFKYRLYDISDMFLFGDIDDVLNFWSCPLPKIKKNYPKNLMQFLRNLPAEIYFTSNFLQRTGWDIKWTLKDSWIALAQRFCIVDTVSVGLYWPKYSIEENRYRNFFGKHNVLEELTFKEWLDLYLHNGKKQFIPEYYIQNIHSFSNDLVLQNNKIVINLSPKHQELMRYFNLEAYKIHYDISGSPALILTDYQNTDFEQVVNLAQKYSTLPIIYIAKQKTDASALENLIILKDDEFLCNELANLRFFPLNSPKNKY